jgi:hypothetical protein
MRTLRERVGERPQVALRLAGVLALASGAALLVHILAGISLGLALLAALVIVALAGTVLWLQLSPAARIELRRRAGAGALAGIAGTIAYDGVRFLLVTLLHWTFWPFDVYPIFGEAIGGTALTGTQALIIGTLYHYTNGVMFAVAYTILFGTVGWWAGILWALGLEALMLSVYPGWLHPKAFGEFVSVSMLGHVAYGAVIGSLGRWWLRSAGPARLLARLGRSPAKRPPAP